MSFLDLRRGKTGNRSDPWVAGESHTSFLGLMPGKTEREWLGAQPGPWAAGESRKSFRDLLLGKIEQVRMGSRSDPQAAWGYR